MVETMATVSGTGVGRRQREGTARAPATRYTHCHSRAHHQARGALKPGPAWSQSMCGAWLPHSANGRDNSYQEC